MKIKDEGTFFLFLFILIFLATAIYLVHLINEEKTYSQEYRKHTRPIRYKNLAGKTIY